MKLLIVDNYGSFTSNLVHCLQKIDSVLDVHVVYNDAYDFLFTQSFHSFDAIIIGPGPGNITEPNDIGIGVPILATDRRPIFGVCLGHQAIAHFAGARVVPLQDPTHGWFRDIHHSGEGLFDGLPHPFGATRYNSWMVDHPLPDALQLLAWAEGDAAVMALGHKKLPRWGVQFHPEIAGTQSGVRIVRNFLRLARSAARASTTRGSERPPTLHWRRVARALDPASIVEAARGPGEEPILLDSAVAREGVSRFSYVAVSTGLGDRTLAYWQSRKVTLVRDEQGRTTQHERSIFELLDEIEQGVAPGGTVPPPFEFKGGAIGWLGYELKSECNPKVTSAHHPDYPTSVFRISHSFLVVDHLEDATYVAACTTPATETRCERSLAALTRIARRAQAAGPPKTPGGSTNTLIAFDARHSDRDFLALIETCRQSIRTGESFELCLANCLETRTPADPWAFYRALRGQHPAPYAAYLPMGGVTVASSSPERFLKIDTDRRVVVRPIRGTVSRGETEREDCELREHLRNDERNRAETMMFVDLLGHDLGTVSEVGSVRVSKLFDIETFPTAHQMVSTVEGRLRTTLRAVDAIKACFPSSSMTGVPKVRSMEILERLENGPRGVHSGVIGWIGFDGQVDLNVVVRAAVFRNGTVTIGCGGPISLLSDPESELAEIKRKARALNQTLSASQGALTAPAASTPEAQRRTLRLVVSRAPY